MNDSGLASLRIERRSMALTIFSGLHLDYSQVRHLASDRQKAEESAIGFVRWMTTAFTVSIVALEKTSNGDLRRVSQNDSVIRLLREEGIPIWEVERILLLEAFGVPPLRTRRELKSVAATIWPALNNRRTPTSVLDAAALGLYVQTERLFAN